MNKGFSLIELLIVIVVLGIVALITFPIVNDILNSSEKNAFKNSIEELVNITELDYTEFSRSGTMTYTFSGDNIQCSGCEKIKYNGEIEDGRGSIIIKNGKTTNVQIENKSYKASLNSSGKILVTEKE